jgi:hypothetical protein
MCKIRVFTGSRVLSVRRKKARRVKDEGQFRSDVDKRCKKWVEQTGSGQADSDRIAWPLMRRTQESVFVLFFEMCDNVFLRRA